MYKLVCIDLDDTLLDKNKSITDENIKEIKRASSLGVKIVLATGRPIDGFYKYVKQLNLDNDDNYSIAFNSALIFNNKKIINKNCLDGTSLKEIYNLSKEINANIHAFDLNGVITPKLSKYTLHETTINNIPYRIIDFNNIKDDEEIIKVMLVDEPDYLDSYIKKIPKYFYDKYNIVRSAPFFLEFLKKDVDKASGVKFLADFLNISDDEIITIGDAGNDFKMILDCKMGVAMKNSMDFVKDAAKYITKNDNNNSGVAEVFQKFIK